MAKLGIQVDRGLVVIHRARSITYAFPAEGQQVVRTGIQLVDIEQALARLLRFGKPSTVREQRGAQQENIRVTLGFRGKTLHHLERFGEPLLAQELEREPEVPCRNRLAADSIPARSVPAVAPSRVRVSMRSVALAIASIHVSAPSTAATIVGISPCEDAACRRRAR